jgi:hypothetical protein
MAQKPGFFKKPGFSVPHTLFKKEKVFALAFSFLFLASAVTLLFWRCTIAE